MNPRNNNFRQQRPERTPSDFYEKTVQINHVSKKGTGGDKRSLSVIIVVGDKKGKVGVGLGKAADFQSAARKASTYARKHMITIALKEDRTIFHDIFHKQGAARVLLKTAKAGTGVIAGGPVRVVVEAAGIKDIVSKTLGTKNKASNVYATLAALSKLKQITGTEAKVEAATEEEGEKSKKVKAKK